MRKSNITQDAQQRTSHSENVLRLLLVPLDINSTDEERVCCVAVYNDADGDDEIALSRCSDLRCCPQLQQLPL